MTSKFSRRLFAATLALLGLALGNSDSNAASAGDVGVTALRAPAFLLPKPVQPSAPPTIGANAVIKVLRTNPTPLARRQVVTLLDGKVQRVDEQLAAQLEPRIGLTAEIVPNAAPARIATPAAFAARYPAVSQVVALPTLYTSTVLNESRAVTFKVALAVLDNLHYDSMSKRFVARVAAQLVNPDNVNDNSALAQDVPILIAAQSATFDPTPVTLRQLNAPREVRLSVAAPADPYKINAVTVLNGTPDSIDLPIEHPEIHVTAVNNTIRGLGLEATDINITVTGVESAEGDVITLQAPGVGIEPGAVTIKSGVATASLRSSGLGTVVVTATASNAGFKPGTETVTFKPPVAFALATLLGALAGAFLRQRGSRGWQRNALIGVVAAFVVVGGHVIGIQFAPWSAPAGTTGDVVFFVIAAVAGYSGRTIMDSIGGTKKAS